MYAAARYLGIRGDEWNRLSWWEQKLYAEGLQRERPWVYRAVMMSKAQDPLKGAFPPEAVAEGEDADEFLATTGFAMRKVTV